MLENCSACEDLKTYAPEFALHGITTGVCNSLKNDTGLNPNLSVLHNNCADLQDMSDCLIGALGDTLPSYDICDIKDFLEKLLANLKSMFDALVCNECGQWSEIWKLWHEVHRLQEAVYTDINGQDYYYAMEWLEVVIPEEDFEQLAPGTTGREVWFNGSAGNEIIYTITLNVLDVVDHFIPIPQVMSGRAHPVTTAWQLLSQSGKNVTMNFDLYQIEGTNLPGQGVPFEIRTWLLMFGKKYLPK